MCALSLAWRNSARKLYLQWQSSAHTHTHTHTHAARVSQRTRLAASRRAVGLFQDSKQARMCWRNEWTRLQRGHMLCQSSLHSTPNRSTETENYTMETKKKDVRNPAANSEGESFPVIHQLLSVSSSHSHKHSTAHFCNGSSHGNWTHEAVLPLSKWWPTVTAAYYSVGTQVIVRKT